MKTLTEICLERGIKPVTLQTRLRKKGLCVTDFDHTIKGRYFYYPNHVIKKWTEMGILQIKYISKVQPIDAVSHWCDKPYSDVPRWMRLTK